jgi:AcrR family transcriptional regulator
MASDISGSRRPDAPPDAAPGAAPGAAPAPPQRRARRRGGRDASFDLTASQVAEQVTESMERASARTAQALDRASAKLDRASEKVARNAASLDRLAAHLGALDVWTRDEPSSRRPRFTRREIAAAAVRIADAEGFGAVSMRRIAAELDAGTMTLYHYVRTKDELLTIVTDAVMEEVVIPDDDIPANWREAMTLLADRSRASLQRHPWILDITDDPPIGPNSVRHFDQSLQAVASLPIDLAAKLDIVSVVDEYVFGYCLQQRNNTQTDDAGIDREMHSYVERLLATGDYPHLAALARDIGLVAAWGRIETHLRDPDRFGRNLARLLDGIETSLPPH